MQTYLEQLREEVRLKQLGLKEQKNQQQRGQPSIYDHINTNAKDSKKWINQCQLIGSINYLIKPMLEKPLSGVLVSAMEQVFQQGIAK